MCTNSNTTSSDTCAQTATSPAVAHVHEQQHHQQSYMWHGNLCKSGFGCLPSNTHVHRATQPHSLHLVSFSGYLGPIAVFLHISYAEITLCLWGDTFPAQMPTLSTVMSAAYQVTLELHCVLQITDLELQDNELNGTLPASWSSMSVSPEYGQVNLNNHS